MTWLRHRVARRLRRMAHHLDPEVRPQTIEWGDGRKLTLGRGWTLEQAMDLMARLREFDVAGPPLRGRSGGSA